MFRQLCKKVSNVFYGGLGFDLGTTNTLVYSKGKGLVVNQPSVIAFTTSGHNGHTKRLLAMGEQAKEMLGRAPHGIRVVSPIEEGIVADAGAVEMMMQHLVRRAYGNDHLMKPFGIIGVPPNASDIARRATSELAARADLPKSYLIEEVMAAALGAGVDVLSPRGSMVVDIGGGTSDVAVISLGGIIVSRSSRSAGKSIDREIVEFVKENHNLYIGEASAEEIKLSIGNAVLNGNHKTTVRGRDLRDGLPKTVEISEHEIHAAIQRPIQDIISIVRKVLEATPPELSSDILDSGITLVGGGALLKGLDKTISQQTGIPVCVAEDPLTCTALGLGKITENLGDFKILLQNGLND